VVIVFDTNFSFGLANTSSNPNTFPRSGYVRVNKENVYPFFF